MHQLDVVPYMDVANYEVLRTLQYGAIPNLERVGLGTSKASCS